jgi:hypothetical protein
VLRTCKPSEVQSEMCYILIQVNGKIKRSVVILVYGKVWKMVRAFRKFIYDYMKIKRNNEFSAPVSLNYENIYNCSFLFSLFL